MCQSLLAQDKEAYIFILAIDQSTAEIVKQYNIVNTCIIALNDFEDEALLNIKSSRTLGEYCWTITPSFILYCLKTYGLPQVCYVDADLFFYNNPNILLQENTKKSILLSPHRYSPKYDQSKTSGIYCVQFMNFKNDDHAVEALIWWRDACIEWCYNRIEPNRFGDQKYLDDWLERFDSVHVLEHLGGGVAPWNVQQYSFFDEKLNHYEMQDKQKKRFDLIFYHFHGVKFYSNGQIDFGGYNLEPEIKTKIYLPYAKKILDLDNQLISRAYIDKTSYLTHICDAYNWSIKKIVREWIQKLNKSYNKITAKQLIQESPSWPQS